MSFVDSVKNKSNYKYSEVYKLLNFPEQWKLLDRGMGFERFQHKSGWYFFTGHDIVSMRLDGGIKCEPSTLMYFWITVSFRERRFVKSWLKLQENLK